MHNLIDEIAFADQVGLDVFGVGEHHRAEFLDSAPVVILSAAAALTKKIRLTSAVTVLAPPIPSASFRNSRPWISSLAAAPKSLPDAALRRVLPALWPATEDYDALFAEKLELLLKLRDETNVTWSGDFRPALNGQAVYPRPLQNPLPVWVGVGGTPASFVRAGMLGLPLMVAIIGGQPARFRPLIDLYREAGRRAGHPPEQLKVGLHLIGFVADTTEEAADEFFPGYQHTFTEIGKERGWQPATRAQFDAPTQPYWRLPHR